MFSFIAIIKWDSHDELNHNGDSICNTFFYWLRYVNKELGRLACVAG
jgi:hypothetical protein